MLLFSFPPIFSQIIHSNLHSQYQFIFELFWPFVIWFPVTSWLRSNLRCALILCSRNPEATIDLVYMSKTHIVKRCVGNEMNSWPRCYFSVLLLCWETRERRIENLFRNRASWKFIHHLPNVFKTMGHCLYVFRACRALHDTVCVFMVILDTNCYLSILFSSCTGF